jgi:hypothetical protein
MVENNKGLIKCITNPIIYYFYFKLNLKINSLFCSI